MATSFGDLQAIYRMEKTAAVLQTVPAEFYSEAAALIAQLEGGYKEPAKKLLEDIYLLRVGKIMRLASRTDSEPPKNMIASEEAMYKEVLALLSEHRRRMVGGRKESEVVDEYVQPAEESVPEDDGKAAVRILSAMPAIVGSDMSHYGPFAEGDEVRLPKKTAHILVEKGAAEEL